MRWFSCNRLRRFGWMSNFHGYEVTDEFLTIYRQLLSGTEPVSHQGKHLRITKGQTLAQPV